MTIEGVRYNVKKGVLEFFKDEQGKGNTSRVFTLLGDAESLYFDKVKETGDEFEASEEAQDYVTRFAPRYYDDVVKGSNNPEVCNNDNVKEVQDALSNHLRILFREDSQKFNNLFGIGNKTPSNEEAYIKFLGDVEGGLPSFVFSHFILDRDVKKFVERVHEYYKTTANAFRRTKTHYRLMYALGENPVDYPPTGTPHINWVELNNLLFKYIIEDSLLKEKIAVTRNSADFYQNITNWNVRNLHNTLVVDEFEKAYLGAVAVKNNLFPTKEIPKALFTTVGHIVKAEAKAKGGHYDQNATFENVKEQIKVSGVAIIMVKNVVFVVGKKLYILERESGGLEIKVTSAYSTVKKTAIVKVVHHSQNKK